MKNIFDPLGRKMFVSTCAILAIITGAIGFSFSSFEDYMANIMVEITGFFIGIVITILIVDIYMQHNRDKQWERVKELTYKGLSEHFTEIILHLCNDYNKQIFLKQFIEQGNNPDKSILSLFQELILEFQNKKKRGRYGFSCFYFVF